MNERILPSPVMQTLFVSRETSNCPLISEMIKLGQRLEELGLADKETGIVSLDYGKRLLINAKNIDVKKMKQHDVVEIVDYDPLKNIMMVIGTKDPCLETPVHWIIQKARHDINALLQINSTTLFEKLKETLPTTEKLLIVIKHVPTFQLHVHPFQSSSSSSCIEWWFLYKRFSSPLQPFFMYPALGDISGNIFLWRDVKRRILH